MSEPLEIEVKIRLGGAGEARKRILAAGAVPIRERHFEDNRIFDNKERELSRRGALLRVRATGDGMGRLTYKEKVKSDLRAKVRREWEVEVQPPEALVRILSMSGFEETYRYQKYRTVFRLEGCHIDLDETPMGCFVEIEGAADAIPRAARLLGVPEEAFITEDYRSLHRTWLDERGLPPGDMLYPDGEAPGGSTA